MKLPLTLIIALLASPLVSQSAPAQASGAPVDLIQKAAVNALNVDQGSSLDKSRSDFTPNGWNGFLKNMQGFLDDKGAPTFTQQFTPAGDAAVVSNKNGVVQLKIPGTLKQTQGKSTTTYRLRLDVTAAGNPPKIDHLDQVTCVGPSKATYCM